MNVSATLNAFKVLIKPALYLPHATISTFNDLPIPVSKAFNDIHGRIRPEIKALVLDKDDCFAVPKENTIYKPYNDKFQALRAAYPGSRLLIVSNSAGTRDDIGGREADLLEEATGVKVLRHTTKKPGCGGRILEYFRNDPRSGVIRPNQIVVVGDRLSTDVAMANLNGFWALWVRDGVVPEKSFITRWEGRLPTLLTRYGFKPIQP